MDLRSHYPFWLLKNGIIRTYPSLDRNITTDVAVIGAGITGALVAYHLAEAGIKTIVLDRRHVGMGSTAASTSLLQYEIDTPLLELQKKVGVEVANSSYLMCRQAIYDLKGIADRIKPDSSFGLFPSLQFASKKSDVSLLEKELKLRQAIGLSLEMLDHADLKRKYGFTKPAALLSKDGGVMDCYQLTHGLLMETEKKGGLVFDHSNVESIIHEKKGLTLQVNGEFRIRAKKVVVACGYESQRYLDKKIEQLHSTFALVTEPISQDKLWYSRSLIWETATPYLYIAATGDGRVMIGGKDVPFTNPQKRDALIKTKSRQLIESFRKLFPHLTVKPDFEWAGTFSGTRDGLPYMGEVPGRKNVLFALGYGGNGITFSLIAAQAIRDALTGKNPPAFGYFSFNR